MSRTNINVPSNVKNGQYKTASWRPAYRDNTNFLWPAVNTTTVYDSRGYKSDATESRSSSAFQPWPYHSSNRYDLNAFSYSKETKRFMRQETLIRTIEPFTWKPPQYTLNEGYFITDTTADGAWHVPSYAVIPQSEIDALDRILRTQLRNQMKDMKVNIQQFIAEREQTIRMFVDVVSSVANCVRDLKRGDIAGAMGHVGISTSKRRRRKFNRSFARDQSKAVANAWIQAQYGIRPLMEDVKGAAESLAKYLNQQPPVYKVEVHRAIKLSSVTRTSVNPDYVRFINEIQTTEYHLKYGCYFTQDLNVSSLPTSLGLTNPASILWELTPWSFVVDWFFPVGNWIASWDATIGITFKSGYRTEFIRSRARKDMSTYNVQYGTSQIVVSSVGEAWREKITCNRTLLSSFPMPGLPAFKNPFSATHISNALSLLRQQFH